jgi:AraC family transcriptional regulator
VKPTLVDRPALHVVGLQRLYTPATMAEIPALWDAFVPRLDEIEDACGDRTYGVCQDDAQGKDTFAYTAAIEVASLARVPHGMVGFTIPAGTWAVFTHRGPISKIVETFDAIFTTGLATAKLERCGALDLEVYDERFDPATGTGEVDIYIPVRRPA